MGLLGLLEFLFLLPIALSADAPSTPDPPPYSLTFSSISPPPILSPYLFAPASLDILISISPPPPDSYLLCYDTLIVGADQDKSNFKIINNCFQDIKKYSDINIVDIPIGEYIIVAWLIDGIDGERVGQTASKQLIVKKTTEDKSEINYSLAILTTSISHPSPSNARPWFDSVVCPRMLKYANKVGAELIVHRELNSCPTYIDSTTGKPTMDTRNCAMKQKILNLESALRSYDRVLLLDDTAIIREDTPDVFKAIPNSMIGGVSESHAEHLANAETLQRMCKYYNVQRQGEKDYGSVIINTGVLLLSREYHYEMFFGGFNSKFDPDINPHLSGDQGYINAMLQSKIKNWEVEVADLGFRFNYIGSFENMNKHKIAFKAEQAYIVHATTGLLLVETKEGLDEEQINIGLRRFHLATGMEVVTMRTEYLEGLDEKWRSIHL